MNAKTAESIEAPVGSIGKTRSMNIVDHACRRLWPLQGKALCARACHRTGLKDFGDPPLEESLSILVESLEREAGLHPLGRLLLRGHLLELLETRLRLTSAWRGRERELETQPVERPVFITGMPRSGSTFLHKLLAQDPNHRTPQVWEVMFPIQAATAGGKSSGSYIRRAAARLWWFRRLAPQADSVHPIRARSPQECVAIHSHTFLSEEFVTTAHVPTYEKYLRTKGLGPAYSWQRRFLQHLQCGHPLRRWVLKCPDHLWALEELFSIFPDAIVVQMHRNPLEVLKSAIQLTKTLRGLFGRASDAHELREHEVRALAERSERSIRFRDAHPELADRFLDIGYAELVSHPMAAIERIYRHLDCPIDGETTRRMTRLISTHSRYRRRYNPTLAEIGFDAAVEIRRFQNYCQRFGIACL